MFGKYLVHIINQARAENNLNLVPGYKYSLGKIHILNSL